MTTDQLAVLQVRAINRPAFNDRTFRQAFAAPVAEDEFLAFDAYPGERRRMRGAIEETPFELIAFLRDLEPVHLVGVRTGAAKVPSPRERVLTLLGERHRGCDGEQRSDREFDAHENSYLELSAISYQLSARAFRVSIHDSES